MLERVANIFVAAMVFFSTTGVVLNRHYCQNELRTTSVFVRVQACHSMQQELPCHVQAIQCHHSDADKGCCHDDAEYVHSDQLKVFQAPTAWVLPAFDLVVPLPSLSMHFAIREVTRRVHHRYRPPDLPVAQSDLLQVFRC